MTGIADPRAAGRKYNVARLLKGVEQHRHGRGGQPGENQCGDKDLHGVSPADTALPMAVRRTQSKSFIVARRSHLVGIAGPLHPPIDGGRWLRHAGAWP